MDTDTVLLIDDEAADMEWLIDLLVHRYGCSVDDQATNEDAAREKLAILREGTVPWRLAIVDIMMATTSIEKVASIDDAFLANSMDSGIRIMKLIRTELGVGRDRLPIICYSAREDIPAALFEELDVTFCPRDGSDGPHSIRATLERELGPSTRPRAK